MTCDSESAIIVESIGTRPKAKTILEQVQVYEAERIYKPSRLVANVRIEIDVGIESDRVFADESSDLRVVVTSPVVIDAALGIPLSARARRHNQLCLKITIAHTNAATT